jgi:hypothetical protein
MKRLKRIFLLLVMLVVFQGLNAQGKMKFSVHFDPQFAWLGSDHSSISADGSIFHMQAGLQMDYYFQENYAFILGFGINNMGGKLHYSDSTEYDSNGTTLLIEPDQSVKLNLQYLDIPLGLKLKTEELGYATIFLQVGFNPMFNINGKISTEDGSLEDERFQESVPLFNLGYHVGAGVEYRLGGSTAAVGGVRWSSGLIDVTEGDLANISLRTISIHLGILF